MENSPRSSDRQTKQYISVWSSSTKRHHVQRTVERSSSYVGLIPLERDRAQGIRGGWPASANGTM